ncbi:hypothetical protein MAR_017003 [Mya arenaria]|uniref:Uncharacterized protein n=1 Tax=Mya arenaria TaxID=6604 RepID=A0ABY7EDD1_MYAAR|nr:hypothetical protein MAR_017003 [Mya arenaria]
MNRRPSHASVQGLRRGSLADPSKAKRVSLKDGTLGAPGMSRLAALVELKEGDVFYRTERLYPSIPDHPEDVTVTLANRYTRDSRTGSTVGLNKDDSMASVDGPVFERDR